MTVRVFRWCLSLKVNDIAFDNGAKGKVHTSLQTRHFRLRRRKLRVGGTWLRRRKLIGQKERPLPERPNRRLHSVIQTDSFHLSSAEANTRAFRRQSFSCISYPRASD